MVSFDSNLFPDSSPAFSKASRWRLKKPRAAICPYWDCFGMTTVSPFNNGWFRGRLHPVCKKHNCHMIFLEGFSETFATSAYNTIFDIGILPPIPLFEKIDKKYPEYAKPFLEEWITRAISTRGATYALHTLDWLYAMYPPRLTKGWPHSFSHRTIPTDLPPINDEHAEISEWRNWLDANITTKKKELIEPIPEADPFPVGKIWGILADYGNGLIRNWYHWRPYKWPKWHTLYEFDRSELDGVKYFTDLTMNFRMISSFLNTPIPLKAFHIPTGILFNAFWDLNTFNKVKIIEKEDLENYQAKLHYNFFKNFPELKGQFASKSESKSVSPLATPNETIGELTPSNDTEIKEVMMVSRTRLSQIITRKVGLRSNRIKKRNNKGYPEYNFLSEDELGNLRKIFLKYRNFQNQIVDYIYSLPDYANDYENFIMNFSSAGKNAYKGNFYDRFSLRILEPDAYKSLYFSDRMKRAAAYYPYYAIRNNFIREGNLRMISEYLIDFFTDQPKKLSDFLKSGRIGNSNLTEIQNKLSRDIYGGKQNLSREYLNNHLEQLRNLLLENSDLNQTIRTELKVTANNDQIIKDLTEKIISGFTRMHKHKLISIAAGDLPEYFIKSFISSIKRQTTRKFKMRMKRIEQGKAFITETNAIGQYLEMTNSPDLASLKNNLTSDMDLLKTSLSIEENQIRSLAESALKELINDYISEPDTHPARLAVKPHYISVKISSFNEEGMSEFIRQKLKNKAKEIFTELDPFHISPMISRILTIIKSNINRYVSRPKFDALTINIPAFEQLLDVTPNQDTAIIGFYPSSKRWMDKTKEKPLIFNFAVNISSLRAAMESSGCSGINQDNIKEFFSSPPILQLKGRKVILVQPFQTNGLNSNAINDLTSDLHDSNGIKIVMGIDLGLKHYAVLSIWEISGDGKIKKEVARYFLNQRALYRKKFDILTGKWVSIKKIDADTGISEDPLKFAGNPGRRLYHLRKEIGITQSQKSMLESEFPVRKAKYYHESKTLESEWNKVQQIHGDIYRKVSGRILTIAQYHHVTEIHFEDLSWSKHSPKNQSGYYLTQNQAHFMHSRIVTQVSQAASRCGISVGIVNAKWTSQLYWKAFMTHPITITWQTSKDSVKSLLGVRTGKQFIFTDISGVRHELDSDLNAARVIALTSVVRWAQLSAI